MFKFRFDLPKMIQKENKLLKNLVLKNCKIIRKSIIVGSVLADLRPKSLL